MIHELKCWPEYFRQIWSGDKLFELRKNDRDFHEGDELWLREWHPIGQCYSGREILCEVGYLIMAHDGLTKDYVCMGIRDLRYSKTPFHPYPVRDSSTSVGMTKEEAKTI